MKRKLTWIVLATLAAGCSSSTPTADHWQDSFFRHADQVSPARRVLDKQAAAGAFADATLRAAHFDGTALSDLGKSKLDAMIDGADGRPITVFVDIGSSAVLATSLQPAIETHLISRGVAAERITIRTGANPSAMRPIDDGIDIETKNNAPLQGGPMPTAGL